MSTFNHTSTNVVNTQKDGIYLSSEESAEFADVLNNDVHAISELCNGLKQFDITGSTPHTGNGDRMGETAFTPAHWAKPHGCTNHLLLGLGRERGHHISTLLSKLVNCIKL